MLSRRAVLFSGGSCALAVAALPSWLANAQEAEEEWSCSAVDPESTDEELGSITDYGADDFDGNIEKFASSLQEGGITPYGTANLANVWRLGDGLTPGTGKITLGVAFLDGSDGAKQLVRTHASKWLTATIGKRIAFRWDVPQPQCQISITFETTQNKSRVGRGSQSVATTQASMHLGQLTERVICHEFGHALGLRHEHSSPNAPMEWNKAQVIADMAALGWTETMVKTNIFDRFGPEYACVGDPDFNLKSIMLYPIKKSWTLNGFSANQTNTIDPRDEKCVAALYKV